MDLQKLTFDSIRNLQLGVIGTLFEREVSRVILDCEDRPMLEKARTVTVTFMFVPEASVVGSGVTLHAIATATKVGSVLPPQVSDTFRGVPKQVTDRNGQKHMALMFRPDEPDDPTVDKLYDRDVVERERSAKALAAAAREEEDRRRAREGGQAS